MRLVGFVLAGWFGVTGTALAQTTVNATPASAPASSAAAVASAGAAASAAATGAPVAAVKPRPVLPTIALVRFDARAIDAASDGCSLDANSRSLPLGALVVLVRQVACKHRYLPAREYLEVLYDGKPYYAKANDLVVPPSELEALAVRPDSVVVDNLETWSRESSHLTLATVAAALRKVQASRAQGVAVLEASIFDTSEHTEGTGFRIELYNTSSKVIKYATVTLKGLNAVKDPVRDRYSRSPTVTLRAVGPIDAGDTASYRREYMWMTDIVEAFEIVSLKVEFMDGTSRVIPAKQLVRLSRLERKTLFEDK